jgi:hypothetical protein
MLSGVATSSQTSLTEMCLLETPRGQNLKGFLQSYLYFGLLSEFFEDDFIEANFLKPMTDIDRATLPSMHGPNNHEILELVQTAALQGLYLDWAYKWTAETESQRNARFTHLSRRLDLAGQVARHSRLDPSRL